MQSKFVTKLGKGSGRLCPKEGSEGAHFGNQLPDDVIAMQEFSLGTM
jgi:hypothetical protein